MHIRKYLAISLIIAICSISIRAAAQKIMADNSKPQLWLTDPDNAVLFKLQYQDLKTTGIDKNIACITINQSETYQQMDGFGFALTGGSAMLIDKMSAVKQAQLLNELFGAGKNDIGVSYLRISIGASDLDDHVFSYDDLNAGQTDISLKKFTLDNDKKALIPILKKILAINPKIKIMATPWSPPTWMKTNNSTSGGHLKPEYYRVYSEYLIKYIKEMEAKGISIDAISIQNEPLNPKNNPSMVMEAAEERDFIKNDLGPGFEAAKLKTKIILYDHNADRPDYPITILNDPNARKYVDGSAFHLYGGSIEALSTVHAAYPDKNLYFTEQWVGAPGNLKEDMHFQIKDLIIGAPRNWCRNVIDWNLAADQNQEPHTPGGCDECLGAVTINGDNVTRNSAYYIIAHASKFVKPGSKRIASNYTTELPNVAYLTPSGKIVIIVFNNTEAKQDFNIKYGNKTIGTFLNPDATGTYIL